MAGFGSEEPRRCRTLVCQRLPSKQAPVQPAIELTLRLLMPIPTAVLASIYRNRDNNILPTFAGSSPNYCAEPFLHASLPAIGGLRFRLLPIRGDGEDGTSGRHGTG